jgi:hypothetical protein
MDLRFKARRAASQTTVVSATPQGFRRPMPLIALKITKLLYAWLEITQPSSALARAARDADEDDCLATGSPRYIDILLSGS